MIPNDLLKIIYSTEYGSKEMTIKILERLYNKDIESIMRILQLASKIHPTMPILRNILREISDEGKRPSDLLNKLKRLDRDIANNLTELMKEKTTILTFSRSQTLLNIFRILNRQGYIKRIYLSEGRPTNEGVSFAEDLSRIGIETILTIDIALPSLVEKVDYVIIGCDAILPNNDIINKVGSKALAIAAKHYNKAFIVAGDEYKYIDNTNIEIKHGPPTDIYTGETDRIKIYNPYFEIIPSHLITYIITNIGATKP